MIDRFRTVFLFLPERDTRNHQKYVGKNRLSIPATSFEKFLAEIISVKKTELSLKHDCKNKKSVILIRPSRTGISWTLINLT